MGFSLGADQSSLNDIIRVGIGIAVAIGFGLELIAAAPPGIAPAEISPANPRQIRRTWKYCDYLGCLWAHHLPSSAIEVTLLPCCKLITYLHRENYDGEEASESTYSRKT